MSRWFVSENSLDVFWLAMPKVLMREAVMASDLHGIAIIDQRFVNDCRVESARRGEYVIPRYLLEFLL